MICDTQLEMYLSELEEEILKTDETGQNYPNLTKVEREALQDLMYKKNIVIKPADKGKCNCNLGQTRLFKRMLAKVKQ